MAQQVRAWTAARPLAEEMRRTSQRRRWRQRQLARQDSQQGYPYRPHSVGPRSIGSVKKSSQRRVPRRVLPRSVPYLMADQDPVIPPTPSPIWTALAKADLTEVANLRSRESAQGLERNLHRRQEQGGSRLQPDLRSSRSVPVAPLIDLESELHMERARADSWKPLGKTPQKE